MKRGALLPTAQEVLLQKVNLDVAYGSRKDLALDCTFFFRLIAGVCIEMGKNMHSFKLLSQKCEKHRTKLTPLLS